jgi:protein-L-isoaspartate O-methyltransferase
MFTQESVSLASATLGHQKYGKVIVKVQDVRTGTPSIRLYDYMRISATIPVSQLSNARL